jgi:hypothetical protein
MNCELTGTPERELNPDFIGNEVITASDVATDIMNNQVSSYDISDLMSEETQAECFRELIGIWASRDRDNEGRAFARIDMTDFIENALLVAAKRKGY